MYPLALLNTVESSHHSFLSAFNQAQTSDSTRLRATLANFYLSILSISYHVLPTEITHASTSDILLKVYRSRETVCAKSKTFAR